MQTMDTNSVDEMREAAAEIREAVRLGLGALGGESVAQSLRTHLREVGLSTIAGHPVRVGGANMLQKFGQDAEEVEIVPALTCSGFPVVSLTLAGSPSEDVRIVEVTIKGALRLGALLILAALDADELEGYDCPDCRDTGVNGGGESCRCGMDGWPNDGRKAL